MKNEFMKKAIELSIESVNRGGGPFGSVIVKKNKMTRAAIDKNNCLVIDQDQFKNFLLHPLWLRERLSQPEYLDINNHQISKNKRDMLKKTLETNEFKVSVAKNGKEGLERVKKAKPALILLDLMMPEMDGFQFAEELRENKEWLDIPVVVITAKDLTKEDHQRLKRNVEAIMQKGSYSRNDLLSEVGDRIKQLQIRS